MLYGSTKSVENDYYNSYSSSHRSKSNGSVLNTIIKLLAILVLITFIGVGYLMFSKKHQSAAPVIASEATTSVTVQEPVVNTVTPSVAAVVQESAKATQKELSAEEIAQIVQIVLSQMNTQQSVTPAPAAVESSNAGSKVDDTNYAQMLMSENVEGSSKTKEEKNLQDINYYNKVVVNQENTKNDPLAELSSALNSAIEAPDSDSAKKTEYTRMISEEVKVRSNEMRVIIVKQGDTLSQLAFEAYGSFDDYPRIYAANPEIQNPDQIFVGQKIRIPL